MMRRPSPKRLCSVTSDRCFPHTNTLSHCTSSVLVFPCRKLLLIHPVRPDKMPSRLSFYQLVRKNKQIKTVSQLVLFFRYKLCLSLNGYYMLIKSQYGLPWWRSGWESACQCRGHGFEPWSGKIPHAAEQLVPWATITEPARLEPVLHNKRGRDSERPAHRDEEWPPLTATIESPCTETKTQHSQKKIINK